MVLHARFLKKTVSIRGEIASQIVRTALIM